MTHSMSVDQHYFDNIVDWKKVYEARVYDDKRKQIKLNDMITIYNSQDKSQHINVKVRGLLYYEYFDDAVKDIGYKKLMPNEDCIEDVIRKYNNFPHNENKTYEEAARGYGVLVIKFYISNY